MSGDNFWEQLSANPGAGGEKPAEPAAPAPPPPGSTPSIDADALAAWLKAEPADPFASLAAPAGGAPPAGAVPPIPPPPPPAPAASGADLNALWPPAAPVDPFSGIQPANNAPLPADWDLGFDQPPGTPPAPAPPPSTPASAVPGAPAGLSDFALDLGGGAPAPAAPYAPPVPVVPGPAPADAVQVPGLKITVSIGRRTTEQTLRGEALIGRPDPVRGLNPEIDLRQDDAVSRRHAKIFLKNGSYVLTDLNSTNGTRYNNQWLPAEQEVVLKAGDEIELGEQTLIRVLEAPQVHA